MLACAYGVANTPDAHAFPTFVVQKDRLVFSVTHQARGCMESTDHASRRVACDAHAFRRLGVHRAYDTRSNGERTSNSFYVYGSEITL